MTKKDFIKLTGENPEDFFGGDWKQILDDWKGCTTPDFKEETIRPCYRCGVDTRFCSKCATDHHIPSKRLSP